MNKPDSIRISPRRLEQLNRIADAHGMSATEAISYFINAEIAAGTIPATIPGFVIKPVPGGVFIRLDEGEEITVPAETARAIAKAIRGVIDGEPGVVSITGNYSCIRAGRGYKVRIPFSSPEVSMTADLAEDLAGLIEKAAE